ncbi:MAG: hypothetical protein U0165_10810 [Polyangiaceae bacterium]
MTLPAVVDTLRAQLEASEEYRWIDPQDRASISQSMLAAFDEVSFEASFQEQGRERIRRSIPLFAGPTRNVRLTTIEQASLVLFDPQESDRVQLALGLSFPPQLWPSASISTESMSERFDPYLNRPFRSAHRYKHALRVVRGSLEELGLESIEQLARVIAYGEKWTDGAATWKSGNLDDPWSTDPSHESMITLRVQGDRAAEEHGLRWPSISMRTLWSRSILTIEQGPFDHVVFELRYDEAPNIEPLPFEASTVPKGIPADLLASLLRGGAMYPDGLAALRNEPLTPYTALLTCLFEPAETTTYAMLRDMLRDDELREPALALANHLGARSLLYELECETKDESLRQRLIEATTLQPNPSSDEGDEGDDFDEDDDEDDYDADDIDEDNDWNDDDLEDEEEGQ